METREDLLPGLSVPAWRPIATLIFLRSRPGGAFVEQVVNIDPLELEAAQEKDAGLHRRRLPPQLSRPEPRPHELTIEGTEQGYTARRIG